MKVSGRALLEASHFSSSRSPLLSCWPGTYETTAVAANSPLRLGIKSHLYNGGLGMGWLGPSFRARREMRASWSYWPVSWFGYEVSAGSSVECLTPRCSQLLSWDVLETRSRSLRSVTLKVMPGPDSPPYHLLSNMGKRTSSVTCAHCHDVLSKCLGPSNHERDPLKQSEQNQIFPWDRLFYFGHCYAKVTTNVRQPPGSATGDNTDSVMKRKGHKTESEELENREDRSGEARAGVWKKKGRWNKLW